jgi:hypothetical protein
MIENWTASSLGYLPSVIHGVKAIAHLSFRARRETRSFVDEAVKVGINSRNFVPCLTQPLPHSTERVFEVPKNIGVVKI